MTEVLTITNTSGTINLMSAASQYASGYFSDYLPSIGEGRDPESTTTDSFPVFINGSSRANLAVQLTNLKQIFEQGMRWQDGNSGPRTFLNWTPEGYAAGRRSEIVAGNYYLASGFKTEFSKTTGHRALVDVQITRRNWWEGPETQADLYNDWAAAGTTAIRIDNQQVSGTSNYADVVLGTLGDLPSSARLEIDQITTYSGWELSVGLSHRPGSTGGYSPWVDTFSTDPSSGGTALANRVGGTAFIFNSAVTAGTIGAASSVYPDVFKSSGLYRMYTVLAFDVAQTYKIQGYIQSNDIATRVTMPPVYFAGDSTFRLIDVGAAMFPPGGYKTGISNPFSMKYVISAASAFKATCDYVTYYRVNGFRKYAAISGTDADSKIIDDGIESLSCYLTNATTGAYRGSLGATGKQILVYPGEQNLFNFNSTYTDDVNLKNIAWTFSLYYRPRYLCL